MWMHHPPTHIYKLILCKPLQARLNLLNGRSGVLLQVAATDAYSHVAGSFRLASGCCATVQACFKLLQLAHKAMIDADLASTRLHCVCMYLCMYMYVWY
jgi:hypothetical protein